MEIKKCQEKDSKAVYNLIGELEEGTLDFSKFELAFKSKINNKKNSKENNCDVIELTSNFSRKKAHIFITKNGFKKSSYKFKMKL